MAQVHPPNRPAIAPRAMAETRDQGSRLAVAVAVLILVVTAWAFTHRLGSFPLLDDPNEAQYAEVAREMIESGDWLSPQLNYVIFLNKPPLAYWGIAWVYELWGIHEAAARLPGAVAAWLTILIVLVWGWRAFNPFVGCLAAGILASMGGFFVETHLVRPDLWLVLGLTLAISALWELLERPEERLWRWSTPLALWQVGLAIGLLAKGMLALLLPAFALLAAVVAERRWRLLLPFFHPRAWWLWLAIVGPWHAAMSFVHSGFLWDYVINQHLLFFFDKKFPRDSIPISLPMFWAAFAMRLFPWSVFVPAAVGVAVGKLPTREERTIAVLLLAWSLAVLALFSAASSRLEHYSLPALPPLALLVAAYLGRAETLSPRWAAATWVHWVFAAFVFVNGLWVVPRLLREEEWLGPTHEFIGIAIQAFGGLSLAGVVALLLWWIGARRLAPVAVAVTFAAVVPLFCRGLALVAPNNSTFPLAQQISPHLEGANVTVVYQAPEEYQTCAGLNYYLRRRIEILPPRDFVLPTYLEPHGDRLFIDAATLQRWWEERPLIWISDPLRPGQNLDAVLPGHYEVIARDATRVAVRNQLLPPAQVARLEPAPPSNCAPLMARPGYAPNVK